MHLDPKGLVALWREALLARAVLRGRTRGYRNHPQLLRFRGCTRPLAAVNFYLAAVLAEAESRGYSFDRGKLQKPKNSPVIPVTRGQLAYEWRHLLRKLRTRNPALFRKQRRAAPVPHPLFRLVPGPVEEWERAK